MLLNQKTAQKVMDAMANSLYRAKFGEVIEQNRRRAFAVVANYPITDKTTGEIHKCVDAIGEDNVGELLNMVTDMKIYRTVGDIKVTFNTPVEETQEETK